MVPRNHSTFARGLLFACVALLFLPVTVAGQGHSIAREWDEVLLEAIRNDISRPTVHARNLFHSSIASYDAWAAYDDVAQPFLLGNSFAGVTCPFSRPKSTIETDQAREEAISYANYRLLVHRFANSPNADASIARFDSLFESRGYNAFVVSTNYESGVPAHLGNYLAKCIIEAGIRDGSNELNDYENQSYQGTNPPLLPILPGNPDIVDPNRFQPLGLRTFIDQGGNIFAAGVPEFLGAEWGRVAPFALSPDDVTLHARAGETFPVYFDPGEPPLVELGASSANTVDYQWAFSLVSTWSSHLDPSDGVLWDISPGALGNLDELPTTVSEMREFFDFFDGGDPSQGRLVNPRTSVQYESQIVPRGDYTRVLAEFWADGPDSETPPGHWFAILNYVSDHPDFVARFEGLDEPLDNLEWDVKAYFALGGAVHDAAIAAWSIKGWYDYVRPISAIRSMSDRGQCTDPGKANYSVDGIPLIDGYIEMVTVSDPLAGLDNEHLDKVKIRTWRGPDYIADPDIDHAGVGWILAENWWPYQRPTFVTPPFAGYISGHSTFSRAAAEVLTLLTGDEYFPGGLGEFTARRNEFLVFEEGPSVDVTLQWATYRDASDQTSISRIWGGIHPPVDDIPGRVIGRQVGVEAFAGAKSYFTGQALVNSDRTTITSLYPNPAERTGIVTISLNRPVRGTVALYDATGRVVLSQPIVDSADTTVDVSRLAAGVYLVRLEGTVSAVSRTLVIL